MLRNAALRYPFGTISLTTTQPACAGYTFGEYKVLIVDGVLLCGDHRIRIEELPFQLLLVLLETPGEVVSKEVLQKRLWSDRIFGELDNVLQVAASKLREALGETAGAPRHIETVRRRGYRFNGKVEPVFTSLPEETSSAPSDPAPEVTSAPKPNRIWLPLVALSSLAAVALAFSLLMFRHRPVQLAGTPDEIALGSFANQTGDASLSGLGYALRVALEESPYLKLASGQPLSEQVSPLASGSPAPGTKGCSSPRNKIALSGAVVAQSPGYLVTITARSCTNNKILSSQSVPADNRDSVLSALDRAALQMRASLGEAGASLQKYNVPLSRATTSSLAALSAFTLGEAKRDNGKEFEAIHDYKLATDLDPQFALAYARLGTIYSNAAEQSQSALAFKKAFDLREHTTDRERLYITSHYYAMNGQTQRTIEAYELWRTLYPRDSSPYENLALEYLEIGAPQKALGVARAAVALDGSSSISQAALGRVYLENGLDKELRTLCSTVLGQQGDSAMLHESCFLLAFEHSDSTAMQEQIRWSRGNAAEGELLDDVAWAAMYQGKVTLGRSLFEQARHAALAQGFSELAATINADQALLEAEFGYPEHVKEYALDASRGAPGNGSIHALAALALARSGNPELANSEMAMASALATPDTILHDAQIPLVLAAMELQSRNPQGALRTLEELRPYDFYSALNLAPAYYRGLAYEQIGKGQEAAASFGSVLDHLALMPDSPYGPLSAMHVSKLPASTGDPDRAAQARNLLRENWNGADRDFRPMSSR